MEIIRYKKILALFLPLIISSILWFSIDRENKIKGFVGFVLSRSSGLSLFSTENLLLYPKLVMYNYITSKILFWFITVLFLITLINILKLSRKLKFIILVFSVFLFALVIHPLKDSRFLLPIFPLFIVTAFSGILTGSLNKYFRFGLSRKTLSLVLSCTIACILFLNVKDVYSNKLMLMYSDLYGDEVTYKIVSSVTDKIIENNLKNIFFIGAFNELNNLTFQWCLYAKNTGFAKEATFPEDIPYPNQANLVAWDSKFNEKYIKIFNEWLKKSWYDSVVTIELYGEKSKYCSDDFIRYCKWKQNYVKLFKTQKKYKIMTELKFPEKNVIIRLYRVNQK